MMNIRDLFRPILLVSAFTSLLSGCQLHGEDGETGRRKAMYEIALSYGAQSGLHWKSKSIASYLDSQSQKLDQIYNFNALLLPHNILPPVVNAYGKSYTIQSSDTIRLADQEIQMVKPATFVSVAPSWRDYIYIAYAEPQSPPEGILPQDPEESELWKQASREGWDIGVEQAASIFQDALSRLNRDFQGMVLFQELHIQNMISAPYTETTELGVTGNQNALRLNDKIIKITRPSVLNTVTNQWHPIIISE